LSTVDVDRSLGDFLECEELAQLVVHQLLDHIDCLRADLDRKKKAKRSVEAQLVNTLQKQPASPTANIPSESEPRSIKKLRSDMGDGESVSLFSDAPRHPYQPHHYNSHPTSTDLNTCVGRVAPPTQSRDNIIKLKMEKRVERLLTPTVYRLPGPLPPAPTPAREPGTAPTQLSSNDLGDMSDDDKPLMEGQQAELAHQNQVFRESRPGPIPEELGVVLVNQNYECDNFFCGMVSCHFYLLAKTNTIYSGVMAVMAAEAKEEGRDFVTPSNQRLYAVVCRGFPMNPREV
jgi:hypothetical protein